MGLANAISKAALAAFTAVADLTKPLVVTEVAATYDADSGQMVETTVVHTVSALREEFEGRDINGSTVLPGDFKVMFPVASLSVAPVKSFRYTFEGLECSLEGKGKDPADAVWTLHLRGQLG